MFSHCHNNVTFSHYPMDVTIHFESTMVFLIYFSTYTNAKKIVLSILINSFGPFGNHPQHYGSESKGENYIHDSSPNLLSTPK